MDVAGDLGAFVEEHEVTASTDTDKGAVDVADREDTVGVAVDVVEVFDGVVVTPGKGVGNGPVCVLGVHLASHLVNKYALGCILGVVEPGVGKTEVAAEAGGHDAVEGKGGCKEHGYGTLHVVLDAGHEDDGSDGDVLGNLDGHNAAKGIADENWVVGGVDLLGKTFGVIGDGLSTFGAFPLEVNAVVLLQFQGCKDTRIRRHAWNEIECVRHRLKYT